MNLNDFPVVNLGNVVEHTSTLNDEQILRCKKIILKPTNAQRRILHDWFYWYRWGYNQAVRIINSYKFNNQSIITSFPKLRKIVKDTMSENQVQRMKRSRIPVHTFDNAIRDVIKAYKSAFSNRRAGNITHFRVRYKKSTCPKETLVLENSAFSKRYSTFAPRIMGNNIGTIGGSLQGISRDSRLQWDKLTGQLTLFVPQDCNTKNVISRHDWCALDPGIRTFQTLYSSQAKADYGTEQPKKIWKLLNNIHKNKVYEGRPDGTWYKKYANKRYKKIQNIRDDLHWKTALQLVKSYDTILVGSMSTRSIVSKRGNLNKASKSIAYMLGHYLFKTRLEAKAEEYGAEVIIVNEAWTSKTCGGCFKVNHQLGSRKHFVCPQNDCDYQLDRDINGARNIALNHFGLFSPIH